MTRTIAMQCLWYAAPADVRASFMYKEAFWSRAAVEHDVDVQLYESARLPMRFWSEWRKVIVDIAKTFENVWATVLSTHAYRLSPFVMRSNELNELAMMQLQKLTRDMIDMKKGETWLVMNFWTRWEFSCPRSLSVEDAIKLYTRPVDQVKEFSQEMLRYMQEAANSVNEIIALSHLFEKVDLPFAVSLQWSTNENGDLMIQDPVYWAKGHLDIMELLEEKTWGYIQAYEINCWGARHWYDRFFGDARNHPISEKLLWWYPNAWVVDAVDHGCEVKTYEEIWMLSNEDRAIKTLEENPKFKIVWNCCGTSVVWTKNMVTKLREKGYTVWNDL